MEKQLTANELRIGNLVECNETIITVNSITKLGINLIGGDSFGVYAVYEFKNLKPIPLTEDWLVKFGFEKALNGWWCPNELISYIDGYIGFGIDRLTTIKYVHELQNLYFSLTGEELTII